MILRLKTQLPVAHPLSWTFLASPRPLPLHLAPETKGGKEITALAAAWHEFNNDGKCENQQICKSFDYAFKLLVEIHHDLSIQL